MDKVNQLNSDQNGINQHPGGDHEQEESTKLLNEQNHIVNEPLNQAGEDGRSDDIQSDLETQYVKI